MCQRMARQRAKQTLPQKMKLSPLRRPAANPDPPRAVFGQVGVVLLARIQVGNDIFMPERRAFRR